jgi:hypothetical protein
MYMQVPTYSLGERDRRWALARQLMQTEDVEALVSYHEHECVEAAPFAPDVYLTGDRPGSIVIFCRDESTAIPLRSSRTHSNALVNGASIKDI